ncbi:hypothetical protein M902_1388 [Bacteriovorax sp. BAL6_X]|uniref:hypothetical protein n=1 Tax=Bacteriovorax sp. BAL6_X TaxID=1201290 RepID=UPI000385D050|nr:hypothetical protein [Bacteriovorax sp. BAL6_X]EPZ50483.1 hypothetical protein M902_1388 [Bacteriovorax sp. BAL6_X]
MELIKESAQAIPAKSLSFLDIHSYEIKQSRSNLKVPVINGVHLHSNYHPAKEAKKLIANIEHQLKENKNLLILGLGFAYHVYEACKLLETYHGQDYKVIVIEPNEQTYTECIKNNLFPNKNIEVYATDNVESIYKEKNVASFLSQKPTILTHAPSFSLYNTFYKAFLDFEASDKISDCIEHIKSSELKALLYNAEQDKSIDQYIESSIYQTNQFKNKNDFLLLAFDAVIKQG